MSLNPFLNGFRRFGQSAVLLFSLLYCENSRGKETAGVRLKNRWKTWTRRITMRLLLWLQLCSSKGRRWLVSFLFRCGHSQTEVRNPATTRLENGFFSTCHALVWSASRWLGRTDTRMDKAGHEMKDPGRVLILSPLFLLASVDAVSHNCFFYVWFLCDILASLWSPKHALLAHWWMRRQLRKRTKGWCSLRRMVSEAGDADIYHRRDMSIVFWTRSVNCER